MSASCAGPVSRLQVLFPPLRTDWQDADDGMPCYRDDGGLAVQNGFLEGVCIQLCQPFGRAPSPHDPCFSKVQEVRVLMCLLAYPYETVSSGDKAGVERVDGVIGIHGLVAPVGFWIVSVRAGISAGCSC